MKLIIDCYKDEFNEGQLYAAEGDVSQYSNVIYNTQSCFSSQVPERAIRITETLMSEVCTVASLILVKPATNSSSERSFGTLRQIESYLRSTMTQTHLNNVMALHVHKSYTDALSLVDIGNEFIRESCHSLENLV